MNKILFLVLTASCVSAIATPTKAQDPYFDPMGAVQADCNRGDVGACELLRELQNAEVNGPSPSSPDSPYQREIDEIEEEKRELDRERNCQNYSYSFSDDTCEQ
jgi:hypothetical protein